MPQIHLSVSSHTPSIGGPGRWSCIVERDGKIRELVGADIDADRHSLTLVGLITGLQHLNGTPARSYLRVVTDSLYLCTAVEMAARWESRGWLDNSGKKLRRVALLKKLNRLLSRYDVEAIQVYTPEPASHLERAIAICQMPVEQGDSGASRSVYVDGSFLPKEGVGGWGAVIEDCGSVVEYAGSLAGAVDNNHAELHAAVEGLSNLELGGPVILYTDSQYVVNGTQNLLEWSRRGWLYKRGTRKIRDREYWIKLADLIRLHRVRVLWVRGHSGVTLNERADQLAGAGSKAIVRRSRL